MRMKSLKQICSSLHTQTSMCNKAINSSSLERRSPELYKWFKDFLGYKESGGTTEAVPQGALGKERVSGELAMEIGQYHGNITTTDQNNQL